jgi:hypothetical protein
MDDSSKRLDLIRNNLRPPLETAFLPPRIPDFQAAERSLPLEIQLPGTEFLDAETGGQKSALETADVRRDGKSGDDTGEIPAETTSLESPTKCAVWEDWMVVCAVRYEPVALYWPKTGRFSKKTARGLQKIRNRA